jgi:hypothetical protein
MLFGDSDKAASHFRTALGFDADLSEARAGLSRLRMPGLPFNVWLDRFHGVLMPRTYLEIGVATGQSLALARPPTLAIGVDPAPHPNCAFRTETHLFTETSDAFFSRGALASLFDGGPLDLVFIDGEHLFEQALRDFMHAESHCGPRSVVLFHDTVPMDELSQQRERRTTMYSGDVWKAIFCLKHFRSDLDIFTIATVPTGLTVVTGLNPRSSTLSDNYADAVARFRDLPYSAIEADPTDALNIVANDWHAVHARLAARGVIRAPPPVA